MSPKDTTTAHAIQLARLNAKLDRILAQWGDLTNRLHEVELEVRQLREAKAREEGQRAGGKMVLGILWALLSLAGGVLGAYFKGAR